MDTVTMVITRYPFLKWGWECPECGETQVRRDGYAHRGTAIEYAWAHARLCANDWDVPVRFVGEE
jgi:hypothetical protein